jgi:two-component system chemotaxis sensor kinase CheA
MDPSKYLNIFLVEARAHLGELEAKLASLEEGRAPERPAADEIFRHAHSIKGMAATMGFGEMARLGQAVENLLGRVKNREVFPDKRMIDLLLASTRYLGLLVDETEEGGATRSRVGDLLASLADLREPWPSPGTQGAGDARPPASEAPAVPPAGEPVEREPTLMRVEALLDPEAIFPAARLLVVYSVLAKAGEILAADPSPDVVRCGGTFGRLDAVLLAAHDAGAVKDELAAIRDLARVSVDVIEPSTLLAGGLTGASGYPSLGPGCTRWGAVRLESDLLDDLTVLVGELSVIAQGAQGDAAVAPGVPGGEGRSSSGGLMARLAKVIMGLRMLPLDLTARRLRDEMGGFLEAHGRSADFHFEGMEVELDRAFVRRIEESLVHLVRNAVQHGLEAPEERLVAGKPACGAIRFAARREQEWIRLEIADDGRGMPREVVARVNDGAPAADRHPGSLQGMGALVASLGGLLSVSAIPGEGTMAVIKLPFAPTFVRVMVAESGGRSYGVPAGRVLRSIHAGIESSPPGPPLDGAGSLDLAAAMGHGVAATRPEGGAEILVGDARGMVALKVESLAGNRDVVIDTRLAGAGQHPLCIGVSRLEDGRPLPIVDVARLARLA